MSSHERMLSLIRDIYTAAADEARWPATLEQLANEFRGGATGFQYRTGAEGHIRSSRFVRLDPALQNTYRTHFAKRNPWTRLSQPLFRTGFVYSPERLLPIAELRRTEFYADILQPAGLLHCFGACVFRRGDHVMSFTVVRSESQGPYDATELTRVQSILPHLNRAMQVNERLSELQRTCATLADGLEQLRHGVVVINRQGKIVLANRAARAIVAQQDGLSISREGLVASAYAERLKLRSLVDDAVRTGAGEGSGRGGAMTITRPSSRRSFLLLVAPIRLATDGPHRLGMATVFISDPEVQIETSDAIARRLYGLTGGEARVATAFAANGSVDEVCEQLGISRETVRWHLRHIYRKTGTDRQAALLKRLVDGPSRLVLNTETPADTGKQRV